MNRTRRMRFVAPVVVIVAGSGVAGAVAIGHTWTDALITEVVTLLIGVGFFLLAKSESDVGAIYGHRADERQREVLFRASRLALTVMMIAAFACVLMTVALGDNYWQADLIGSLGGLTYLLGLMIYGAHDSGGGLHGDVPFGSDTTGPGQERVDPTDQ